MRINDVAGLFNYYMCKILYGKEKSDHFPVDSLSKIIEYYSFSIELTTEVAKKAVKENKQRSWGNISPKTLSYEDFGLHIDKSFIPDRMRQQLQRRNEAFQKEYEYICAFYKNQGFCLLKICQVIYQHIILCLLM